ncbi:MAG TPA: hypothetical protein VL461_13570 [Dictyobacter sp.]|nr:hypothetical protein [Dictyobacter sp.]
MKTRYALLTGLVIGSVIAGAIAGVMLPSPRNLVFCVIECFLFLLGFVLYIMRQDRVRGIATRRSILNGLLFIFYCVAAIAMLSVMLFVPVHH